MMSFLNFRRIEISDKEKAEQCLKKSCFRGSEYTFGNNFVWRNIYNVEVCFFENYYFTKQGRGSYTRFVYPAGGSGDVNDVRKVIGLIADYAKENNLPLRIYANKQITESISQIFPNAVIRLERDFCDYIYLADDLENLKGKKFHAKRNHLNRFYENEWSFEPLTSDNIGDCVEMGRRWRTENIDKCEFHGDIEGKLEEFCIVECSLKYYDKLDYTGGVLRVNGEVQAFAFGERSYEDCFVVHVEKAMREYQGAYAAINRELVKSLNGQYYYINREDDAGAEGLRKAKFSYNPIFLEEKYEVTFGGVQL